MGWPTVSQAGQKRNAPDPCAVAVLLSKGLIFRKQKNLEP
jgi:hypothetical protein